ncbi:uncharacterized protein LOC101891742 [Musca domestica]|uniref:Uncharacterized protein LOC101891742 n=1 Tax=Musca domestica TaxID=7370 RepID=A0A1I8NIE3_MUSDO|nr:uncharacterized protein LOC101891742 [Musca domestica]
MGAGNSTPQTTRIENPKRGIPIEVTPSVVTRLENAQKLQGSEKNLRNQQAKEDAETTSDHKHQSIPAGKPKVYPDSNKTQGNPNFWSDDSQGDVYRKKYNEHEEYQFDKTFEKLENILGKPIEWKEDIEGEILHLRKDLIKCYSDNPGRTLHCSEVAKKYQDFVFDQQYKSIVKLTNANEESAATPTESPSQPYQHSPPYH